MLLLSTTNVRCIYTQQLQQRAVASSILCSSTNNRSNLRRCPKRLQQQQEDLAYGRVHREHSTVVATYQALQYEVPAQSGTSDVLPANPQPASITRSETTAFCFQQYVLARLSGVRTDEIEVKARVVIIVHRASFFLCSSSVLRRCSVS